VQDDLPDNDTVVWEKSVIEKGAQVGVLYRTARRQTFIEPFRNMSNALATALGITKGSPRFDRGPVQLLHRPVSGIKLQPCPRTER
jgi:hypothetical protein